MDDLKNWVAIYAAIVATGAFFLNFRTWFESGPRLRLTVIPDGMVIGGGPATDERDIVILTVTNLGKTPVLITNLLLWEMPTWWQRVRKRPARTFVVTNPALRGSCTNIPFLLEQARTWNGVVRHRPDIFPDLLNGNYYVGLSTSHLQRPILRRITRPLAGAKQPSPMPNFPPDAPAGTRRRAPPMPAPPIAQEGPAGGRPGTGTSANGTIGVEGRA